MSKTWLLFVLFAQCKRATQKWDGYLWHLGGIHKNDLHGWGEEVGTFSSPAIVLRHGGFASFPQGPSLGNAISLWSGSQ